MNQFAERRPYLLSRPLSVCPNMLMPRRASPSPTRSLTRFACRKNSASAIANAVVDPSEVRKYIGDPNDPDVEKIPVPGGLCLAIRTSVWARSDNAGPPQPSHSPLSPSSFRYRTRNRRRQDPQVPACARAAPA